MVVKQGQDFLCHDLTTSVIKASVKSYLLKKNNFQLKCFLAFLIVTGRYDDHVESVASSHFCLFGAGSSESSVGKQNVRTESCATLFSTKLEISLWPIWLYIKTHTQHIQQQ